MVKKLSSDDIDRMSDRLFEISKQLRLHTEFEQAAGDLLRMAMRLPQHDSALRIESSKFRHEAQTDALTELPNRAGFYHAIQHELAESMRIKEMVIGLAYVDLDGFKEINDRFGHEKGDEILVEVAMRLQEHFRDTDTVCRMGGDEMVIIMPYNNTDEFNNAKIAEKVRKALDGLYVWDDGQPTKAGEKPRTPGPYPIGASVGIASSNEQAVIALRTPEEKMEKLSKIADGRMYLDKWRDGVHTPADKYELYHPKMARLETLRARAILQHQGATIDGPLDMDIGQP